MENRLFLILMIVTINLGMTVGHLVIWLADRRDRDKKQEGGKPMS